MHKLLKVSEEAARNYIKRFLFKHTDFIAEEFSDGFTTGYTPNYIKVYVPLKLDAGKNTRWS